MYLKWDQQRRALRIAVEYAQGRNQAQQELRRLFADGFRKAGLKPRWYGELARELERAGLLTGPSFPPQPLVRLAGVVGLYLWFGLAAVESDREDETRCRKVLDRILQLLGTQRLQDFDFERLQPGEDAPFPSFNLRLLRNLLPDYAPGEAALRTIRNHLHGGRVSQAVRLMEEWPQARYGHLPNCDVHDAFNQLAGQGDSQALREFVHWRQENGYPLTQADWSILLHLARTNDDREELARTAQAAAVVPEPDEQLTQELICAYERIDQPKTAVALFDAARARNLSLNEYHYTAMIPVAAQLGDMARAEDYFEHAHLLAPHDSRPWAALVNAYVQAGLPDGARETIARMRQAGVPADGQNYHALLLAYAKTEQPERARETFEDMQRAGVTVEAFHYNALVKAYGQAGQPLLAEETFQKMQQAGIEPDSYSYRALITAYGQAGLVHQAHQVFAQMLEAGITPNQYHYGAFINAYGQAGLARQAQDVFAQMQEAHIAPNQYHFGGLIKAYGQAGLPRQAHEVFNQMQDAGINPNVYHYSALINAYGRDRRPEDAETILKACLTRLTPPAVERTSLYNLVIKAYSASDRLADATRLKEEMLDQGVPIDGLTQGPITSTAIRTGVLRDPRLVLRSQEAEQWKELAILFEDVIHELNQLIGRIGLSRKQVGTYLDRGNIPEAKGANERLKAAVAELGDRIRVYQGLTRGRNDVDTFRVFEIVEEVCRVLQVQAEHASVRIKSQISDVNKWNRPLFVRGDPFLFRLALRNLVLNGIQALSESDVPSEDRWVRIEAFYSPPQERGEAPEGWVDLYVRNNGPPVPEEVRQRIFERGFSTKRGRGLGLGLSLVQSVAEAHGGRVVLNEGVGPSVEFWLRVPAALSNSGETCDEDHSR